MDKSYPNTCSLPQIITEIVPIGKKPLGRPRKHPKIEPCASKTQKMLVLSNKEKLDLLEREIEQAPDITRRKKAKDKLYALKKRIRADFHKLYLKNLITK